jgi:hypothetical protein
MVWPMGHFYEGQPPRGPAAPVVVCSADEREVRYILDGLKQELVLPLKPLYGVFEQPGDVGSFHIDYTIITANRPGKKEGQLHVRIESE